MLGIISDIHGNYDGLIIALKLLNNHDASEIICLGDLVDGGKYPMEVIDEIQNRGIECVRGNHDVCNNEQLPDKYQEWLNQLPDQITRYGCYFTHISPRKVRVKKIKDEYEAWNAFEETSERRIFIGHTHLSIIFNEKSQVSSSASICYFKFGQWNQLDHNDRYIISPGSIGYSRDSRNTLRCAVYDYKSDRLKMLEFDGPQVI